METWKDVFGFENQYEVNQNGDVRRKQYGTIYKDGRVAHFSNNILKQSPNKKGYSAPHSRHQVALLHGHKIYLKAALVGERGVVILK